MLHNSGSAAPSGPDIPPVCCSPSRFGEDGSDASGHDTSGDLGHFVSDVASASLDVAGAAASAVTNVAAGIVAGALSVMTAPTVSYGDSCGGGGSSASDDLGDDYYIDEHGIRRKKRRGLRR